MKRTNQPAAARPDRSALVQVEKPIYGGAFLARVEGKATFVPLALTGEQARVRIVEERRSYATAELEAIVTPSLERIAPGCRHFGACGGCQYQHANYEAQLAIKQEILRETLARGGVRAPEKIDVLAGDPWHYRNRIRLALDEAGRVGYRGRRSHAIVPISECPIAAPLLVRAALSASEIPRNAQIDFWPAEISLFCNQDESALLASVFIRDGASRTFDRFAQAWKERIPELAGAELVVEGRPESTPRTVGRWGESSISYQVGGFGYRVDHGAFFQVNRWLIGGLAERVTANRRGAIAWDLFAGVGLFAKRLANQFERVTAVESAPSAASALVNNLEGTVGKCVKTDALQFLKENKKSRPDLIVVDPPRAGLGAETTSLLAGIAAPAVVYVSCDPSTLARDLRALIDSGYAVASLTLADLFPQTFHLETMVELLRS